jgi:hypothetical protein
VLLIEYGVQALCWSLQSFFAHLKSLLKQHHFLMLEIKYSIDESFKKTVISGFQLSLRSNLI